MIEFGEQLKRAREKKGMTQQSLAEKLFVTRQAVSRWECGDRFPDLITTKKISEILEVSMDELMADTELSNVVEKTPVIENQLGRKIILILYAFIALGFLILCGVSAYGFVNEFKNASFSFSLISVTGLIVFALEAAIFFYGFISSLKSDLIPAKAGIISILYIALGMSLRAVNGIDLIKHNAPAGFMISFFVPLVCSLLALGSLVFIYFKKAKSVIPRIYLYLYCGISVLADLFVIWFYLVDIPVTQMMDMVINNVVRILIYVLIIYETEVIVRKRNLSVPESESIS